MEEFNYIDGQTPLDEDEREGLLIPTISTRSDLDEFEQQNIERAMEWTMGNFFSREQIFTEIFVRNLHRRMYGEVWKWAGEFRRTEKSIGIDPTQIGQSLKQLNDNCLFWIDNKVYADDEIAIRYKHELVKIHCFANGNGRHSRLMADIIINHIFGKPVFTWGRSIPIAIGTKNKSESRNIYLQSLRQADDNNILPLLLFAKS
jgi:Fic-DOC domain mobile mystery protein B